MRPAALLLLLASVCAPVCALAQTTPPPATKPAPSPPKHAPDHKPAPSPAQAPTAARAPAKPAPKPAHPPAKATAKPAPPSPAPVPVPAAAPEKPAEPNKGSNTGLPLPRFAALRSDDVNFRSGPGTRYPIEWVYKRRDLPVQIEREFETWRLVRDPEGNKGWVLGATLTGRRTAVVATAEHALRQAASDTAGLVAQLKPGVILRLRSCEASSEWCQAQVGDYRGFIRRSEIWGVMPGEVVQ